jgi:hypothetical protein
MATYKNDDVAHVERFLEGKYIYLAIYGAHDAHKNKVDAGHERLNNR